MSEPRHATVALKYVVSAAISFHFAALILAIASNLAPSNLQGELMAYLSPYQNTTSQSYGFVSLELTHAEPIDFPLIVELQSTDGRWSPLPLTTNNDVTGKHTLWRASRWANVARILRLIAEDDPQSEILSEFAAHCVRCSEQSNERRVVAVRFFQPHVPSFDEDAVVAAGRGSLIESELESHLVFFAHVVRSETGEIAMVPRLDPARTSKTTRRAEVAQ